MSSGALLIGINSDWLATKEQLHKIILSRRQTCTKDCPQQMSSHSGVPGDCSRIRRWVGSVYSLRWIHWSEVKDDCQCSTRRKAFQPSWWDIQRFGSKTRLHAVNNLPKIWLRHLTVSWQHLHHIWQNRKIWRFSPCVETITYNATVIFGARTAWLEDIWRTSTHHKICYG